MNRKSYIGSPRLPENQHNHELGKWCYMVGGHCETAVNARLISDCIKCLTGYKITPEGLETRHYTKE